MPVGAIVFSISIMHLASDGIWQCPVLVGVGLNVKMSVMESFVLAYSLRLHLMILRFVQNSSAYGEPPCIIGMYDGLKFYGNFQAKTSS